MSGPQTFNPKDVPPERWAGALAMALLSQLDLNGLFNLVTEGEKTFVKHCMDNDQLGLKKDHYRDCFKKLRRRAIQLGYSKN